jgi:hypothetical protein
LLLNINTFFCDTYIQYIITNLCLSCFTDIPLKTFNKESVYSGIEDIQRKKRKYSKQESLNLSDAEKNLKMQRVKQVMDQEQQLVNVKLRHEENMAHMREKHLKELNEMETQHKKVMHNLEIKINETKLKILENQLLNKENIDFKL